MYKISVIIMTLILIVSTVDGQTRRKMRGVPKRQKQIEELQKVRLLEILDLDEESSVKFITRRNKYRAKMKSLINDRIEIINRMESNNDYNEKIDENERKIRIDSLLNIEMKLTEIKIKYVHSLKDIMTFKQIEKIISFESSFNKELKRLLFKRMNKAKLKNIK